MDRRLLLRVSVHQSGDEVQEIEIDTTWTLNNSVYIVN